MNLVYRIEKLKRGHETIYRVIRELKNGLTAIDIHLNYKANKAKCGRKRTQLTNEEKARDGWTPDVIIGRNERPISCSMRTSAGITLVERLTKCIIAIKPEGKRAADVESSLNDWLDPLPKHLFKSIIFDCGKELSNWKSISNKQDIDIYFADPGTPSQRGLNEHSNGLLRRNGLPKDMDFNPTTQTYISEVAFR